MRWSVLCLSWVVALPPAAAASPQAFDIEAVRASKRVAAVRVGEPIAIDGALDEASWALAQPATDFHQQFPDEFAPATERSEVRFLYDNEMLYVGAMLYDDEPNRLITDSLQRNFSNYQSDSFLVVLDTFLDRRTGYGFNTNAAGAQRDAPTWRGSALTGRLHRECSSMHSFSTTAKRIPGCPTSGSTSSIVP